jgi:hypothetical protein
MYTIIGLENFDIHPFKAELPVADIANGIGTEVDFAYERNRKLGVVELKSGSNGGAFQKGSGPLTLNKERYGEHIPDNSPLNQAQLQLALTIVLMEESFGVTPEERLIIHVSDEGISSYELTKWFFDNRRSLYEDFIEELKKQKKAKKTSKQQQPTNDERKKK